MKKLNVAAVLTAFAAVAAGAQAKPAAAPAPAAPAAPIAGVVVGDVVQWKGVVVAINPATRHVVLQGPHGNWHLFTVRSEIPNLDKVKKGDTVSVDYMESVAIYLREAADSPMAGAVKSVTIAPKGLPAITNVVVKELTANVTAVDQAKRTLTVIGPQGGVMTFNVDPAVKAFASVKVGDQIVLRATEAMAITVNK